MKELLEEFARICNETTGANFTITKDSNTNQWEISFPNIKLLEKVLTFRDKNLEKILNEAKINIVNRRKPIKMKVKYIVL